MKVEIVRNTGQGIPSGNPAVQFFSGEAWTRCFDKQVLHHHLIDENGQIIGGFVAYEGGKANLRTLITPPFTPHVGLYLEETRTNPVRVNTRRKQAMEAIAEYLKNSRYAYYKLDFAPEWCDMQPMLWNRIRTHVRYTYRIDLRRTVAEIQSNMDSSKRNKVSKAEREGMTISHEANIDLAMSMISGNLDAKNLHSHPEIMRKILQLAAEDERGIWSFTYSNGKAVAVNVCIITPGICYNLLSAVDRGSGHTNAGSFSLYHSILRAKEKGLRVFDFEGSGVPEIEEFFRSFGGDITPYFSVEGGQWPWTLLQRWRLSRR